MIRNSVATARFGHVHATLPKAQPAALGSARWGITSTKPSSPARSASTSSVPDRPNTSYLHPTHTASLETASDATRAQIALAERYLVGVYARPDFVLSHGKGSWVWDTEGRRYLDFCAGIAVNALGHADEGMVEVLKEQASKLLHSSNVYHNLWAPKLAQLLAELTRREGGLGHPADGPAPPPDEQDDRYFTDDRYPGAKLPAGPAQVFFSNSGTEANEGALKIARKYARDTGPVFGGKTFLVCFENAFHGRTMGALSVTPNVKYQKPFRPLVRDVRVGRVNEAGGLRELIGEDTCAVIVEPVQGEGGVNVVEEGWLREVRRRCDEVKALLIFDEVQCGLYRTGSLWAHSKLPVDCHPDIVTMAKPLAGGYPIGAVMVRNKVAKVMKPGTHGTTFGGSPLACALGHHVLSRISAPEFVKQIHETSAYLRGRLERLPGWFPGLLQPQLRGRGLMFGLGFNESSDPGKVAGLARDRGLMVLTAGQDAVRLVPSLNVGKEEVDFAVDVLESCLSLMEKETE